MNTFTSTNAATNILTDFELTNTYILDLKSLIGTQTSIVTAIDFTPIDFQNAIATTGWSIYFFRYMKIEKFDIVPNFTSIPESAPYVTPKGVITQEEEEAAYSLYLSRQPRKRIEFFLANYGTTNWISLGKVALLNQKTETNDGRMDLRSLLIKGEKSLCDPQTKLGVKCVTPDNSANNLFFGTSDELRCEITVTKGFTVKI